ncbi:MAG: serine/threonine-protein kinase [Acidobacteria bacterium]|nr:serine/threonine-protein kinase [Acidobacteriota bacterium]
MIAPGTKLGPYEILGQIGAGGMGEVYKAKDTRVDRTVAVKVLPEEFFEGEERRQRFEREAKLLASLNHPGIATLYSFEEIGGRHLLVMELVDGETLRERITAGALPVRKAVELGVQIVRGLAAAHESGIVHRDLKPENVVLTKDGRAKILDFGLAKQRAVAAGEDTKSPTMAKATDAGTLLGTVGYMAPEQVRGLPADARSDIFAFGCVLFEMLTGKRAFKGDSAIETMNAILKEEPAEPDLSGAKIPPELDRLVRHCLEKNPAERFQSARDLAFDLEASAGSSATGRAAPLASAPGRRTIPAVLAAALLAAAAFGLGHWKGKSSIAAVPSFAQLTFRQEPIFKARLAPDGKTVVYSAAPSGNTPEIFSLRSDFPGASPRLLRSGQLLAISSKGELAVLTRSRYIGHSLFEGTLARMPLEGGAPREILDGVREADWSPDGVDLAVIRDIGGKDRLEFPAGKILAETGGYFSEPRFSPRGDRIAFFEHPFKYDDRGEVAVVDLAGKKTVLSEGYWGEEGLAWSPSGDEVMFSAGNAYNNFRVYAVGLSGKRRVALESAGGLTIHDIRADGRWLATRDDFFREMQVLAPGQSRERDLSWLDLSDPAALSADGKTLLFMEESGSVGVNYAVCLRQTDGSPVVRLGEGAANDLSRDGKWALANVPSKPPQLLLYPTGAGEPRKLERGGLVSYESAQFFPDGKRVLACGPEEGKGVRCYVQDVAGGKPRPVTPEGTSQGFVSPDGRQVLAKASGGALVLYPAEGGEARPLPGAVSEDSVIRWSADGRAVLVSRRGEVPARMERLDVATGRREAMRTVGPTDLAGVLSVGPFVFSNDGKSYAYACRRMSSHLFLVEGAR